jgi:hypothetical protein
MSKLEVLEQEITNLSARERRKLKVWFDQFEGVVAVPSVQRGNGQKPKGLLPRVVLPEGTPSMATTIGQLREEK